MSTKATRAAPAAFALSPMAIAIAAHREAHERYRFASTYRNALPQEATDLEVADDASTAAFEHADEVFRALASAVPNTVADVGALALHLRMILSTAEHYEKEFAPASECFNALVDACLGLAGRGAS